MPRRPIITSLITAALLGACGAPAATISRADAVPGETRTPGLAPHAAAPTMATHAPQSTATVTSYGPEADRFPSNINPMTGLPATDPKLLKIPAVLVSISHFPPAARPQAGLSFAPFVYEFSITGGETRFLAAFYGQFPEPEVPVTGQCEVRTGVFRQTDAVIGNRVWLDSNGNGEQDVGEAGIPGICVGLLDASGRLVQSTTTDTNGLYGFNVATSGLYSIAIGKPAYMDFTIPNLGNENTDSDADAVSGIIAAVRVDAGGMDWDAGLRLDGSAVPEKTDARSLPEAAVGPVRSGRLLYAHLAASYTDSCLIYAYASPEILGRLPHCAFVSHEEANGGQLISIERMRRVAEDNMRHTAGRAFDYASNAYSDLPSPGGTPALELAVSFGNINQSAWIYDPLYRAYLRYVDNADINMRGILHPDVDRLTGRQLYFENVVLIMVETEVVSRTNLDIHLDGGNSGPARLFRNGQVFSITWSTRGREYEQRTGVRKPIQFLNPDGSSAALKPGHTWVIIVTPFSTFEPEGNGVYSIRYAPPEGEAQ